MSIKNSDDTIGIRTRNLPFCREVPHPSAPPGDGSKKRVVVANYIRDVRI